MIDINVELNRDNENLNCVVDMLEADITFIIKEFNVLLEKVCKNPVFTKNSQEVDYIETLKKSLNDRSQDIITQEKKIFGRKSNRSRSGIGLPPTPKNQNSSSNQQNVENDQYVLIAENEK